MLGIYVENHLFLISFLDRAFVPKRINFLYPLDDMTAVHSWIQAEHSQRHNLTISNIGEDVSDIFIVKMDKTNAKADKANTDQRVSVTFFSTIWICKVLRINSFFLIRPKRPLPIHSSLLTLPTHPPPFPTSPSLKR